MVLAKKILLESSNISEVKEIVAIIEFEIKHLFR